MEHSNRDSARSNDVSDSLLPGTGSSPTYGLNESTEEYTESRSRWSVVVVCALTACIASLVTGMSLSFSSIVINELNTTSVAYTDDWQPIPTDGNVASIIGCLVPVGAIFGGIFAWPAADYLGRQAALIVGGIPSLIGWLLISLSVVASTNFSFFALIYVGRALTGFSCGWSMYCVSVYIAEVASSTQRGLLGNCNQLFVTFGVLLSYILGIEFRGTVVKFYLGALVPAAFVAIFEILMLFTYETPRWLFGKNKDYIAIKVLKILRGPDALIMKEIDHIKAVLRKAYTVPEQIMEFKNRSVYLPFVIVFFLMFFQQFSGINAAIFYTSTILNQTGFQGNSVAIISAGSVGLTQVLATVVSVFLVDRLGRRVLLLTSSVGMTASAILLAIFFYVFRHFCHSHIEHTETMTEAVSHVCMYKSHLNIMAIVAIVIFIASFSLGWGPIPWTAMSELLPNKVRGLAAGIASLVNWSFATIITLCFSYYSNLVHPEWAWATFAIFLVLSFIFVFLLLPETKGRSLEEIQENFERGRILAVQLPRIRKTGRVSPMNSRNSEIN